jgi:subtilisin family serine protease
MNRLLLCALLLPGCADLSAAKPFTSTYFVKVNTPPEEVSATVDALREELDLDVIHVYDNVTTGFSVVLPDIFVPELEEIAWIDEIVLDEGGAGVDPGEPDPEITVGESEIPDGVARIGGPFMLQTDFGGLRVAVIDTGVDSSHPDLNVVHHEDIVAAHTGDDADGGDPIGHGTHVAGTIGARADGVGVVGVAPGVEIVDVRVLGSDGTGYMTDILAGIEYVADHPDIRVVNLSLGGPAGGGLDDEVDAALANLEASGVLLAIAAGNDGRNVSNTVPAGLDRGVVVSAYSHRGGEDRGFASFSNFGEAVDVTAPGVGILSTWPGGGYAALDGTSMATPHVAGLAAVLLSEEPELDATEARRRIVNTAEGDLFGANSKHDEPMVDLQAALDN